jgi:hypothetical protein
MFNKIENTSYPIYFDKRPIKVAFLVNPKTLDIDGFKNIFNFNFSLWNGRFNPIIFTDGKKISEESWSFLKDFDPDIIKSLTKIEPKLLKKIDDTLSPYSFEYGDPKGHVDTGHTQFTRSYKPTKDAVLKIAPRHMWGDSDLVLFNLQNTKSNSLKDFIHINFGTYEYSFLPQIIRDLPIGKECPISDSKDLSALLLEFNSTRKNVAFPIQLSTIPNYGKEVEYNKSNEHFTVIVGDSIQEIVYYWNRSLAVPHWLRPNICHIWLPTDLAKDEDLKEGLQMFFRQQTSRIGNNDGKAIQFVSFTLTEKELTDIAKSLGDKVWGVSIKIKNPQNTLPNYGKDNSFFHLKPGMELYQAHSSEENIVIDEPDFPEGTQGENWMLDVYLQYRPEKFQHTNVRHWWRLPNKNHLTHLFFSYKIARIKRNGIPSVLMETKSDFKPDEGNLTVGIPNDSDVIRNYIYGHNRPPYTGDPRGTIIDNKTHLHTQRSDKGRYLSGLIGLFKGLPLAHRQFSSKYWRKMFDILSHQNIKADEEKKKVIFNKLKKRKNHFPFDKASQNDELLWLAEYTLSLSKEQSRVGKEIDFSIFVEERKKDFDEENKKQKIKRNFKEEEEELKEELEELIEQNVLFMGVKPHCPSCGYSNWYHVDEIKQKNECAGCGHLFPIYPEQPWFYRLNSLVQAGCSHHGLVPVLLTLGQLQEDARSSFIYDVSLDLFNEKKRKYKHLGDLDIVCIQDGKFIIGEIKQTIGLFKQSDFEKTLKIAKLIRPNKIIFSSLDKPNALVTKNISELNQKLKDMEIEVEWVELHPWNF